jgi:hypothetical protein
MISEFRKRKEIKIMYEMAKAYEEMAEALVKLSDECFEEFLKDYNEEYREMFCKMRGFYKLMTDAKFYKDVQNAIAKQIWEEAQAV